MNYKNKAHHNAMTADLPTMKGVRVTTMKARKTGPTTKGAGTTTMVGKTWEADPALEVENATTRISGEQRSTEHRSERRKEKEANWWKKVD